MEKTASSIEAPLLQVPVESLKKKLRERKVIMDEVSKAYDAVSSATDISRDGAIKLLDDLVERIEGISRTSQMITTSEKEDLRRMEARIAYLNALGEPAPGRTIPWNRKRMDRIIADYLMRNGYTETAHELAVQHGLADITDTHLFDEAQAIAKSLMQGDCSLALEFCAQNRSRLKKARSRLEFRLRTQEFIDMARRGKNAEAIAHARKHMAPVAKDHMAEFKRALSALVFGPHTDCARYKALFSDKAWGRLKDLFLLDFYALHGLPSTSLLQIHLEAGLSALKTPQAFEPECSKEDPLHLPDFQRLAKELPWAKHVHSKLVCPLTHEIMDDHNPPLMLPNGHVYSTKAVEIVASRNEGMMVCPISEEAFPASKAKRLYIL